MRYPAATTMLMIGLLPLLPLLATAAEPPRPMYARPAQTSADVLLDGFVEYFDGLPLQEAVDLKGWTAGFDLTVPVARTMQLRLLLPLRTEAKGTLVSNGNDIDIKGWGGTFSFATLYFEHQIMGAGGTGGGANRLAWYAGFGQRTGVLETDTLDRYNHRGRSIHLGLRYDRPLAAGGALLLDFEVRSYDESDDLNPGSLQADRFTLTSLRGGWIAPSRGRWTPGVELIADAADNYFSASLVPELLLRTTDALDLKLGVPVGLTSDAPDIGTQLRLTLRF